MEIPVYLFAGFLDSGKTSFLNDILADGFARETPTLLLCCEEGEEEYDPKVLDNVTVVTVDSQVFPAVTNVGVRPTVDENGSVTVESHLLDEKLGLYGEVCRVEFLKMLRPEHRFDDLETLRQQIIRDADEARAYFSQRT